MIDKYSKSCKLTRRDGGGGQTENICALGVCNCSAGSSLCKLQHKEKCLPKFVEKMTEIERKEKRESSPDDVLISVLLCTWTEDKPVPL